MGTGDCDSYFKVVLPMGTGDSDSYFSMFPFSAISCHPRCGKEQLLSIKRVGKKRTVRKLSIAFFL